MFTVNMQNKIKRRKITVFWNRKTNGFGFSQARHAHGIFFLTDCLWATKYIQQQCTIRSSPHYYNNNNLLHLYIHLWWCNGSHIASEHHTTANWWRRDRVMKPISVWGRLGRHDGPRAIGTFFWPECQSNTLLFFGGLLGICNDHRESGPRFNISSEGRCFLQYSVPINILGR